LIRTVQGGAADLSAGLRQKGLPRSGAGPLVSIATQKCDDSGVISDEL
jgi:hypothetical protein